MNEDLYHILIVDDHPIVTAGVAQLLRTEPSAVFYQANDLATLNRLLALHTFHLCIADLEFPGTQGFGLLQLIHESQSACPLLIYTMHDEPWIISKLVELKKRYCISGAVSKHAALSELSRAVNAIRRCGSCFCDPFHSLGKHPDSFMSSSGWKLSEREKDVLTYLVQGLSTKEIAQCMYLSVNTIQTYRKRLFEKLDVKNVVELVSRCKGLF